MALQVWLQGLFLLGGCPYIYGVREVLGIKYPPGVGLPGIGYQMSPLGVARSWGRGAGHRGWAQRNPARAFVGSSRIEDS